VPCHSAPQISGTPPGRRRGEFQKEGSRKGSRIKKTRLKEGAREKSGPNFKSKERETRRGKVFNIKRRGGALWEGTKKKRTEFLGEGKRETGMTTPILPVSGKKKKADWGERL